MLSIDLIKTWTETRPSRVDLLAIAECSDVHQVKPVDLDGEFWVFVKSQLSRAKISEKCSSTIFNIDTDIGSVTIQVQAMKGWK